MKGIARPGLVCIYICVLGLWHSHKGSHAEQNSQNPSGLLSLYNSYTYEFLKKLPMTIKIPDYPENPQNFGEKIRKIRHDKELMIKGVADAIGVTEDSIINWERRGMRPRKDLLERLMGFYGARICDLVVCLITIFYLNGIFPVLSASLWI